MTRNTLAVLLNLLLAFTMVGLFCGNTAYGKDKKTPKAKRKKISVTKNECTAPGKCGPKTRTFDGYVVDFVPNNGTDELVWVDGWSLLVADPRKSTDNVILEDGSRAGGSYEKILSFSFLGESDTVLVNVIKYDDFQGRCYKSSCQWNPQAFSKISCHDGKQTKCPKK